MSKKLKEFFVVLLSGILSIVFVSGVVYAATTISTDINTGGLLNVTGLASLNGQASTTQFSAVGRVYVGGVSTTTIMGDSATSTFAGGITLTSGNVNIPTAGSFLVNGTKVLDTSSLGAGITSSSLTSVGTLGALTVTGMTTHNGPTLLNGTASTTGDFSVNGQATTTAANGNIATKGTLTLANSSTAIAGIVFGVCNISNSSAITASTTAFFTCTGATGVTTSHRVFVQATSSLPTGLTVTAASSTAQDTISLQILNLGLTGNLAPGGITLNFFGIR